MGKRKVGIIVLAIFSVLYLPSFVIMIFKDKVDTAFVDIGSIENYINSQAIIIRNEKVITAPFEGKYVIEVSEGEKVKANTAVATVVKESADELFKEERMLNLNILQVQKAKEENQGIFSNDISKIDNDIKKNIKLIIEENNINGMSKIDKIVTDIDVLLQKKTSIIGGIGSSDAYLNSLKQQRDKLQDKLSFQRKEVISDISGIVSYSIDGYEKELNTEMLSELTPTMFNKIRNNYKKQVSVSTSVDAGKPFSKVIKDICFHIVVCIDKNDAEQFSVGDSVKVRINDINKVVKANVSFKSNQLQDKYILAVKTDEALSDTVGLRCVDIDLIKDSYSGLMVPLKSLIELDSANMKAKLMLIRANIATEVEVKLLGKNSTYAILEQADVMDKGGVSLYRTYVVNPQNIREGQIIEQ